MIQTFSLARDGGKRLHEYFAVREWRCKDGSDKILIDDDLIPILASVRGYFGAPVVITSGYRTPSYNKGASRSQHMAGCAADIQIAGARPRDVARYAMTLPGVRGVGLYEYSGQTKGRSFCHIDTGKGLAAANVPVRTKPLTTWYQDDPDGPEKAMPNLGSGAGGGASSGAGASAPGSKPTPGSGAPTAAGSARPTLRAGSRGSAVVELQRLLDKAGLPCGAHDGIFGVRTLAAVKAFQTAHGLVADGIVGSKTWVKLEAMA